MRKIQLLEETNHCIPFADVGYLYENYLISSKGTYFPYNHVYDDQKWGCAWRSIQMLLSNQQIYLDFKQMFQTYGRRQKLMEIIQVRKPGLMCEELQKVKFAPQQNEYNWAQPFIGELICADQGVKTQLLLVNGYPKCYAPQFAFEKTIDFKQFYERIKQTLPENIIMIDNGQIALTIIGYKEVSASQIHLILADPHILSNKENKRTGIYEVILDENGDLKQSIVQEEQYYLFVTFKKITFMEKQWMALFIKKQI